ncbi:fibronectin type III domain-containing protein [bacterium]|nr:fibronectin type III domain-containing protein [bacterium]
MILFKKKLTTGLLAIAALASFMCYPVHAASWWEVYFTAGDGTIGSASALETHISDFMLKASSMCYVSNYSWSDTANNKVVLNINSLYASGLDVKVVGDDAQGGIGSYPIHPDITGTIPMNDRTTGGSSEYMHNKLIIRDPNDSANAAVMMGSGNFNEGGWESQNNTFLFLYDQDLTLNYLAEFNEMFNGTFAGGSQTTRVYTMPNNVEVRSFFGSEDQPWADVGTTANGLISIFNASTESIFFEVTDLYGWSGAQNPLEASCVNRAAAGAIVEGVYQSIDTASTYDLDDWNNAANANGNGTGPFIRESAVTTYIKHHHKYWVIDLDWAGVGSVNASQSSAENNPGSDENFILIKDFRLAREFAKEFGRNYAIGSPVGSVDNASVGEIHDWSPPGAPTVLSVTNGGNAFSVSWTAPADPGDFSRYYVFISSQHTTSGAMDTAIKQTTDAQGGHLSAVLRPENQNKGISSTTASVGACNEGDALEIGVNYYIGVTAADIYGNESALLFSGPHRFTTDVSAPCAVSNLTALAGDTEEGTITLSWTAPGNDGTGGGNASSYLLKYSSAFISTADFSSASTYSQSWTPAAFGTEEGSSGNRAVSGLIPGLTYWFVIKTADSSGNWSSWTSSNTAAVNTANWAIAYDTSPAPPSGLTVLALSSSTIRISWSANSETDLGQYNLEYSSWSSSAGWQAAISTTAISYTHLGLETGNTYYYRVNAEDNNGNLSPWPSQKSAYPVLSPPLAPAGFSAAAVSASSVRFNWTDVDHETGYVLKYSTDTNSIAASLSSGVTFWFETGLSPNSPSYKVIIATNSAGNSSLSGPATAWSLANPPQSLAPATVSISSVTLSWDTSGNPSYTRYGVSYSTVSGFAVCVSTFADFASDLTGGATSVLNLISNRQYYFRNWAYNEDGVMTAFTSAITTITLSGGESTVVVLNEVMANALDETTGEYFELYNTGSAGVSIEGWTVGDNATSNDTITDYTGADDWGLSGAVIPAGGYAVCVDPDYAGDYTSRLAGWADTSKVIMVTVGDSSIGNGLTNSGETLYIKDTEGVVIGSFTWTSDTGDGISWEKIISTAADPDSSNWTACTHSTQCTPGWQNTASTGSVSSGTISSIVISEIGANYEGVTAQDFIELYNPTSSDISLAGASLQRDSVVGAGSYTPSPTTNISLSGTIPAHGFFLVVDDGWATTPAGDISQNIVINDDDIVFLVANTDNVTGTSDADIVDFVGIGACLDFEGSGAAPQIVAGQSLERRPGSPSGNATDTDDNAADFFVQAAPNPKNSSSAAEFGTESIPPSAISDLTASGSIGTVNAIDLQWTATGDDGTVGTATSYSIKISSTGNISSAGFTAASDLSAFSGTAIPSPSPAGTLETLTVTGLTPGVTYWFAVKALDDNSNSSSWDSSANSNNNAAASQLMPPSAAQNLTGISLSSTSIRWTWTDASFEDGYKIYSSTDDSLLANLAPNVTSWIQYSLAPNTSAQIYVVSWNNYSGFSASTATAAAVVTYQIPPASSLTAPQISSGTAVIYWTGIIGVKYRIARDNVFIASVTASNVNASFSDNTISAGASYIYEIFSVNSEENWDTAGSVSVNVTVPSSSAEGEPTGPYPGFIPPGGQLTFGNEVEKVVIFTPRGKKLVTITGNAWYGTIDNNAPASNSDMLESGAYIYEVTTNSGKIKYGTAVIVK